MPSIPSSPQVQGPGRQEERAAVFLPPREATLPADPDRLGGEGPPDLLAELPEGAQAGPRPLRQVRRRRGEGHSGLLQQLGPVRRRPGKKWNAVVK